VADAAPEIASHRDALQLLLLSIRSFNGTDCFAWCLLSISSTTLCLGFPVRLLMRPAAVAADGPH
jgi:hypothetical protein